jgi:hypothetical protein
MLTDISTSPGRCPLARSYAGGNPDIELLAGRQAYPLFCALDGVLERNGQRGIDVEVDPDAAGVEFELIAAAARTAAGRAAEHAVEDVLEAAAAGPASGAAARVEGVGLEAARSGAAARVAAAKALEARLALGIDLAAVELLALVLVAEDLVRRVELGKALGGLRIALVAVGVMLLGGLAKSALDGRSAGAPRHPQDLIGVAHPSNLLIGNRSVELRQDTHFHPMWVPVAFLQRGGLRN